MVKGHVLGKLNSIMDFSQRKLHFNFVYMSPCESRNYHSFFNALFSWLMYSEKLF